MDDERIPEAGRTVKCTSCGARWSASREAAAAEPEPEPQPEVEFAPDEVVAVEPEAPPEPPLRRMADRRRAAETPKTEARGAVLVWAAAAALVVALVAGAIGFRGEVVRLWPKSGLAYAGLGMPVDSVGLVIEQVRAEPTFLGGRPVLSVTGAIRNVRDRAVTAPALRVNLLNRAGAPIAAKIARPLDPNVPAGATRHFAIAISDPPSNARDLEVSFESGAQKTATTPIPALAPPPADAQPLPPGTPESLTEHG